MTTQLTDMSRLVDLILAQDGTPTHWIRPPSYTPQHYAAFADPAVGHANQLHSLADQAFTVAHPDQLTPSALANFPGTLYSTLRAYILNHGVRP